MAKTENTTQLVSNEWKHTLETIPTKSINSLVSLWDLLYYEDENNNKRFWIEYNSTDNVGTKLSHDIICYNRSMINAGGTIDTNSTASIETSTWWTYGIDISLPRYDSRAKCKTVHLQDNNEISKGDVIYLYDKDAVLAPKNISEFTLLGVQTSSGIGTANLTWNTYSAPSLGVWTGSGIDGTESSIDIFVSSQDIAFTSTLVTQESMSAYNRIILNPKSIYTRVLFVRLFGLNSGKILNVSENSYNGVSDTDINGTAFGTYKGFFDELESLFGDNYKEILKNTFVWVRAPFYADYIIPESFNQDLNQDAKVKHSELMLSGPGDFNKYDTHIFSSNVPIDMSTFDINNTPSLDDVGKSEDSMPYLPRTTPLVDFYTSNFVRENGLGGNDESYSPKLKVDEDSTKNLEKLINEDLQGNNMPIRGLPVASVSRSGGKLDVPGWLDPESKYTSQDYQAMGRLPTVLPKDGNLYVNGRIISPTTDEIIYILRELISGRPSDVQLAASEQDGGVTQEVDTEGKERLSTDDIGIPLGTGNNKINRDTTLSEVIGTEYNFNVPDGETTRSVHGSPIDFMFDGSYSNVTVTKYVNQNDSIVYPIYKALKDISSDVTKFDTDDKLRDITNFTAWKDNTKESVVKDGEAVNDGMWAPRDVPFSLRELEAMIKANKFNLTTLARFLKENYTVAGKLGKVNGEKDNLAAGSLYQMHKDYNFDVANPNTYYNNAGTDNGYKEVTLPDGTKGFEVSGAKALIDDNDIRTPASKSKGNPRYAQDYGTSDALMFNPENYSSSDVYLSASGEWRYVSDHNRIPVLRSEY